MKNKGSPKLYCLWWGRTYPLCLVCLQQLSMTFYSLGYLQVYSKCYRDVRAELCQWITYIHLPCMSFMWGLRFKCQGSDHKVIPNICGLTVVWYEDWNRKIHLGLNFIFTQTNSSTAVIQLIFCEWNELGQNRLKYYEWLEKKWGKWV